MSWNSRLIHRATTTTLSVLITLSVVSCTQYKPQSVIIPKDKLSEYNPKHFGNNKVITHSIKNEDEWIMRAIWHEQMGAFKQSNAYYSKLYKATNKDEYLLKEILTAYNAGAVTQHLSDLELYVQDHPMNLQAKRLLITFYLNKSEYENAKRVGKLLITQSSEAVDFELIANPYVYTNEFEEAIRLLSQAYNKTFNDIILLKITSLMVNKLRDVDGAVNRLENHIATQGCSEKVCLQLAEIYTQQQNVEKLIPLYKSLYELTGKKSYADRLVDAYIFTKKYDDAILFAKTSSKDNELLFALYIDKKDYSGADRVAESLWKSTKDPKWKAESAMALFESSHNGNDKEMLKEVVKRFEEALSHGVKNSVFLNYYGYILIDKDIDVSKGIEVVKKALLTEPENSYYLDSLAWGYYKINHCDEAYTLMQKVVELEGLEEKEIVEHWDVISQKCNKEK